MRKDQVADEVERHLEKIGVPAHTRSVKAVPSVVEASVIVGGSKKVVRLRAGITRYELDMELERMAYFVDLKHGTVDLEEVIGGTT